MINPATLLRRYPPRRSSQPAESPRWPITPAARLLAHEADATMSPDGWETDYAQPLGGGSAFAAGRELAFLAAKA